MNKKMKTVTSVSGGKTSAYLAANYPTDYNIFALVTTNNTKCKYPDDKVRQIVSDKIGRDFIGTLEDNVIIDTILDLAQFLGKEIIWVAGKPFEELIDMKKNYLPNVMTRYCTTWMKLDPIFKYWYYNIKKPVYMNIGFRGTEERRANKMLSKLRDGFDYYRATFKKTKTGKRNRWEDFKWRIPRFPLVDDGIEKNDIELFWKDKPVRFAYMNNCIGCFHRSASVLNQMAKMNPEKFDWFIEQETRTGNTFKKNISYKKIKDTEFTMNIPFGYDSEGCDSGFCGI